MPLQPQIPRAMLSDPRKLNEWLSSQVPVSISNAGRGHEMTSPSPRLPGQSPREEGKFVTSVTAAALAKTVEQQKRLQEQFSPRSAIHAPQRDERAEAQKEDDQAALMWSTAATATVPMSGNATVLKRSQALISHQRDPTAALQEGDTTGKVDAAHFGVLATNLSYIAQAPLVDDAHFTPQVAAARRLGRGVLGGGYDDALCDDTLTHMQPLSLGFIPTKADLQTADAEPISPRRAPPQNRPNASFLTPERFRDGPKGHVPPVGHYRPKHMLTESTIAGGYINPLQHRTGNSPTGNTMAAAAADTESPLKAAPETPHKSPRRLAQEKSRNAVPPAPLMSSIFRSGTQKLVPPPPTDGADEWYWPRCDAKLSPKTNATDMNKGSPRRTIYDVDPSTQPSYNTSRPFGSDTLHKASQLSSSPARFASAPPMAHSEGSIMAYDPDSANQIRYRTAHTASFDKSTPRGEVFPLVDTATSVDDSPRISGKDNGLSVKRVQGPQLFDRQTSRPNVERKLQEEKYEVNETLTLPRQRGAVIDPRAVGHQQLYVPSMTEFGEAPSLTGVRPSPRAVTMDKGSKREPITANILDLTYDTKDPSTSRVTGNPMMGLTTTRAQREKVAEVKKIRSDVMYDVPVLPTVGSNASLNFGKQVTTETCFSHRNAPSHKFTRTHERAPAMGTYDPGEGFNHLSTSPKHR